MSRYHFVHRQLLLGPVVLPITESVDNDTTTEQAYEDFDGVVTCRFYVEARVGHNDLRAIQQHGEDDLWFTLEIDNKLRGQLARFDCSTSWSVHDGDPAITVVVDEVEDSPEKVVLILPGVVDEALKVALDEYRALGITPNAIAEKARARAQALGTIRMPFEGEEDEVEVENIAFQSNR